MDPNPSTSVEPDPDPTSVIPTVKPKTVKAHNMVSVYYLQCILEATDIHHILSPILSTPNTQTAPQREENVTKNNFRACCGKCRRIY